MNGKKSGSEDTFDQTDTLLMFKQLAQKILDPARADRLFRIAVLLSALLLPLVMTGFFLQLGWSSAPAWREFGLSLLWSTEWDPVANRFGALPAIVGTLLTTSIAIVAATPPAFIIALYLVDAPPWIGRPLSQALDLLAAIPSVIYGMWGLFVLVPVMQNHVQPFLADTLRMKHLPFVGEYFNGFGILTAGIILALMILPYISAIMRDVFRMTPPMLRESAYGIGCTRWETAVHIVMRYGARGLLGGVFVGLGRALGETMAVLFVIGNVAMLPDSIFAGGTTIAATLANNFAEADGLLRHVLFALGLVLLVMSFIVQLFAQSCLTATAAARGEER